jgi:hypothetical protein
MHKKSHAASQVRGITTVLISVRMLPAIPGSQSALKNATSAARSGGVSLMSNRES